MAYKICPECDQPILRKGQVRKADNEYRHAHGCPLDDYPTPVPVHVVQIGECVSCTNHKEYIAELRAALLNADDMLMDIYVGKEMADDRWGAAFTKHDELGCSSEEIIDE